MLVLSHLKFILMNIFPDLVLKVLDHGPRMPVGLVHLELIVVDIVLRLRSVVVDALTVVKLLVLQLFIHLLLHHVFLLLLVVH